ncbi:unnamed protein product, partial [marine sediment metagenome]
DDEDKNIRREAASALGKIGDKSAIEPLTKALDDEDKNIRREAASALGKIGDKSAIECLIKALKDEDKNVRREVVSALGKIGDKSAIEPLVEALNDRSLDILYIANEKYPTFHSKSTPHSVKKLFNTNHNFPLSELMLK